MTPAPFWDSGGAEKLLGQGDMLFSPVGAQKPLRIQGCFVSDSEIESVVDFVKNSRSVIYDDSIAQEIERSAVEGSKSSDSGSNDDEGSGDPMMNEAIKCVVEAGQASTSLLQRRLRLGYARAAVSSMRWSRWVLWVRTRARSRAKYSSPMRSGWK